MKRVLLASCLLVAVWSLRAQEVPAAAPAAAGEHECFPLQIAIWPEAPVIQIVGRDMPVHGLKLNVFSGRNDEVHGLDLGLFSRGNDLRGVQMNAGNYVETKAVGLQVGIVNGTKDLVGVGIGAVNYWDGGTVAGVQIGLANISSTVTGVQIGLFNHCRTMKGVQIGLYNRIETKAIPFFPILNAAW